MDGFRDRIKDSLGDESPSTFGYEGSILGDTM